MNMTIRALPTVLLLTLWGCSQPPSIVGEPELEMNPSGNAPLSGLLTFRTDQPARATLTIGDGEAAWRRRPRETCRLTMS